MKAIAFATAPHLLIIKQTILSQYFPILKDRSGGSYGENYKYIFISDIGKRQWFLTLLSVMQNGSMTAFIRNRQSGVLGRLCFNKASHLSAGLLYRNTGYFYNQPFSKPWFTKLR